MVSSIIVGMACQEKRQGNRQDVGAGHRSKLYSTIESRSKASRDVERHLPGQGKGELRDI